LALALAGTLWGAPAHGEERLTGPLSAQVLRVLDGDTLEVRAQIWLGQAVTTRVRLAGVDAPELSGKCPDEKALAARARAFLSARIGAAADAPGQVVLRDVRYGKFAGRVLARVETPRGEDLAGGLISAGLARPYSGRRRQSWCVDAG